MTLVRLDQTNITNTDYIVPNLSLVWQVIDTPE